MSDFSFSGQFLNPDASGNYFQDFTWRFADNPGTTFYPNQVQVGNISMTGVTGVNIIINGNEYDTDNNLMGMATEFGTTLNVDDTNREMSWTALQAVITSEGGPLYGSTPIE